MGIECDPLTKIKVAADLINQIEMLGVTLQVGCDFDLYAATRLEARGSGVTPFFAPGLSSFTDANALWILGEAGGRVVHLQAFRADFVDHDFSVWMMNWMLGLQLRHGEPVRTTVLNPVTSDIASGIKGQAVYHGEFWVSKNLGRTAVRKAADLLSRLAIIMAHMKWSPSAIWSIVPDKMIDYGYVQRSGYYRFQRDWIRWDQKPKDANTDIEHIAVVTGADIENLIKTLAVELDRR